MWNRAVFGAALRTLREQKEVALGELAAKVGMSAPYLCNIELGKFPPPSEEKLRSIAYELGHDSDELLAKAGKTASDLSTLARFAATAVTPRADLIRS
jgi:HTH-type transcriptional regulator, competence development regulator